jgi:hypothetical protein
LKNHAIIEVSSEGEWLSMRRLLSVMFCLWIYVACTRGALASAESDYKNGLTAYKARSYKIAAQYLQRSAKQGMNTPLLWLYLGHAWLGSGDKAQSIQAYSTLVVGFPNTPESTEALRSLWRLDPAASRKAAAAAKNPYMRTARATAQVNGATVRREPLINRIVVVPPKMGHPAVSGNSVAAVRKAVQGYPQICTGYWTTVVPPSAFWAIWKTNGVL